MVSPVGLQLQHVAAASPLTNSSVLLSRMHALMWSPVAGTSMP